jgi:hypothetical protein
MINFSQSQSPSPLLHVVPTDPGLSWVKDTGPVIDAPPDYVPDCASDNDVHPLPEAQWLAEGKHSGLCGVVSPRVIALPGGGCRGYRIYYSQMLPRRGFPAGANDYDNCTTRIVSATSPDGLTWTVEPGIRFSPEQGGVGVVRVVSCEVIPTTTPGQLRMYFECCHGPQSQPNAMQSALSDDGGLQWKLEPGIRFARAGRAYDSPRIIFLDDGRCRLYCSERGQGIISAVSEDGGLSFEQEPGLRIAQDGEYDAHVAFACDIVRIQGGGYIMYYAGYSAPDCAYILRATSDDGLSWQKHPNPIIAPGYDGKCDAVKCSEVSLYRLPDDHDKTPRYRLVYEACDGTAVDNRGVWRIAGATSGFNSGE